MRITNRSNPGLKACSGRNNFGHWMWVIPVFLIVAVLAFRLIDLYPPTFDEFFSMRHAAWTIERPGAITEVLAALRSADTLHSPLYFVLLQTWGRIIAYDIAIGRVLTIFISILALAVIYRLAEDFVGKAAGNFATIVVASNAFYNFYLPHMRMYPLLVLTSAIVLWCYLRIQYGRRTPPKSDYLTLFAASYALANTHLVSALFFLSIGSYHLFLAPKNRRWLLTSLAVSAAILLYVPWPILGLSRAAGSIQLWVDVNSDGKSAVEGFLHVFSNGNTLLLAALSSLGLAVGRLFEAYKIKPYLFMIVVFLLVVAAIAQFTEVISLKGMRFLLTGLPPFALLAAAGLYGLYRLRRWLGLLVFLWVVSGISFQESVPDWWTYVAGRESHFDRPPWQLVSRKALRSGENAPILGYGFDSRLLISRTLSGYSQHDWYFGRFGIPLRVAEDLNRFRELAQQHSVTEPSVWIFYDISSVDSVEVVELNDVMKELNYEACESLESSPRLIVIHYRWDHLQCEASENSAQFGSALIDYEFYGSTMSTGGESIVFVDSWSSREGLEVPHYRLSHQLINHDWEKVAQVDVPLVHEGRLRRFWIDVSDVPPGTYSLMAVLYDARNGERIKWSENSGSVPEMLPLGKVELE